MITSIGAARKAMRFGAVLAAGAIVAVVPTALGEHPSATAATTASKCRPFTTIKAAFHTAASRRIATLSNLVAVLQPHTDPFELNRPQSSVLQQAQQQVMAIDDKVQHGCYTDSSALRADAAPMFDAQRVYWLRVPQTHVIEAADYLSEATRGLSSVANELSPLVKNNTKANGDLTAMNAALAASANRLGSPPMASANIAKVATLVPAADMSENDSIVNAARADLTAAAGSLAQARDYAVEVVTDLQAG